MLRRFIAGFVALGAGALVLAMLPRHRPGPMREAYRLIASGRPEAAARLLKAEAQARPDDVLYHYAYQEAMRSAGRLPEVSAEYRERLRRRGAGLDYFLYISSWCGAADFDAVIAEGRRRHPEDGWAAWAAAIVDYNHLMAKGEAERALKSFDGLAVTFQPEVHAMKAMALMQLSRHREAIAESREAIRLFPVWYGPYLTLGRAHASRSENSAAIAAFKQALALRDSPTARASLAGLYYVEGLFELQRRQLEGLVKAAPVDEEDYSTLSGYYSSQGQAAEAKRFAAEATRRSHDPSIGTMATPDHASTIRWAAVVERLARTLPPNENIYGTAGIAALLTSRPEEAEAYFTKAIDLNPAYYEYWHRRGCARSHLGKNEEALLDLKRAEYGAPRHPEIIRCLAVVNGSLNRDEEAARYYQKAAAIYHTDPALLLEYANLLFRMGRLSEARGVYLRARSLPGVDTRPVDRWLNLIERRRRGLPNDGA